MVNMQPHRPSFAFVAPSVTIPSTRSSSFLQASPPLCRNSAVGARTGKRIPTSRKPTISTRTRRSTPNASAALSNVLIIGGNEALGRVLSSHLSQLNVEPLVTTYDPKSSIRYHGNDKTSSVHLDLLKATSIEELLATTQPSIVISCIGSGADFSLRREPEVSENEHEDIIEGNGHANLIENADDQGLHDLHEAPDLQMTKNVIDACAKAPSVKRFIYMSSLGAADSEHSVPVQVMISMRPILLDKTDGETYLKKDEHSKLGWTIIRPAPLVDEEPTGSAVVTKDVNCYGTVTRTDLAKSIVDIIVSERTVGCTLHVVDRTKVLITSPYVRPLEFWEGLPFSEYKL